MRDGVAVPNRLHDIWDVYNEVKARRTYCRTLIEVVKRSRGWDEPLLNALAEQERWADRITAAIDLAHGVEHDD